MTKTKPRIFLSVFVLSLALGSAWASTAAAAGISVSAAAAPEGMMLVRDRGHKKVTPVVRDGRKAWPLSATTVHGQRVYFKIASEDYKDGAHPSVVFTIDYYDEGTGRVTLQYDSLEEARSPGAFKTAGTITLGDTKTWKTAAYAVTDARFDDRCDGCDFRLTFNKDVEFDLGALRIAPGTAEPSVNYDRAPRGKVIAGTFEQSRIYPGTVHKYTLYVPKQYDPAKPACVYISQDGLRGEFVSALNKLIHKKQVPVMVAVGIHSGVLEAPGKEAVNRGNRCYEYDSLGDEYARFLLEEMLPFIAKTHTLNLSNNGNDRVIGGGSSGGICAFNAAWERPDAFRRVFCVSGSFAAFRGGDIFPVLIRQCESKPLRIFMHVGSNDMVNSGGDWWLANLEMERALKFAGYDYQFRSSDGRHMDQYVQIFPEAMTWLWRDWPRPVPVGSGPPRMQDFLLGDEPWKLVGKGYQCVSGLAANRQGEVFFSDPAAKRMYKVETDGKVTPCGADAGRVCGLTADVEGRLVGVSEASGDVLAFGAEGPSHPIAGGIHGHAVAALHDGGLYVTSPGPAGTAKSQVWYVSPTGEKKIVDTGLRRATGVAISVDGWLLFVADAATHWVYSYQINADRTLSNKQRFYWLHVPDDADDSGADGLCVDREGRLFVATRMGIQISGLQGHGQCILSAPDPKLSAICFGGPKFDILYAACGDKLFRRKLKAHGTSAFQDPIKPPPTKL